MSIGELVLVMTVKLEKGDAAQCPSQGEEMVEMEITVCFCSLGGPHLQHAEESWSKYFSNYHQS